MLVFCRDFRDVDLFVGGVSEKKTNANRMGPTFACLTALQFYYTKFGDRFFYEHKEQAGSFTKGKLI